LSQSWWLGNHLALFLAFITDYLGRVSTKFSKIQKNTVLGLAVALLIFPAPFIVGEITKKNLVSQCEYIFQYLNKDLKKAEQAPQYSRYFIDAGYFAYQFRNTAVGSSDSRSKCISMINPEFRERIIRFDAALLEHNRIYNNFGTDALPPTLPYKSTSDDSNAFRAECELPVPLMLKFHTNCVFYENMNINIASFSQ